MPHLRDSEDQIIDLAIEGWRLARLFQKSVSSTDLKAAQRQSNQIRYFNRKLDEILAESDLSLVSLEGQPYDGGMAATPLNVGDFDTDDSLFVDVMMEPIVMGPHGIRRTGTMMLRS
ncbi:hypothetical protein MTsN3n11_07990 [Qipengyuania sp. MTN3-11]